MTDSHDTGAAAGAAADANKALLRAFYDAVRRGDARAAMDLLADDVVFHQPGRNPTSGDYRGKEAAVSLPRLLADRSGGTFRFEVHDVAATHDHAIGLLRISGRRDGRSIDMPAAHVFHIRDGKLAELWIHPLDQHEIDEFWA